jgi:hypothetical protein
MNNLQEILQAKTDLCKERDLCAELYNVWITKLHDYQHDKEKYEFYMKLINNMEPYGQMVKEQIRELNRKICQIEGKDSIGDTEYEFECIAKYGFDAPNVK